MAESLQSNIMRAVSRVLRRLWLRTFVHAVLLGWAAMFLLAAVYFAVRGLAWGSGSELENYLVLTTAAILGLAGGAAWSFWRAPGRTASALALDEKFGLKERVTTLLTLPAYQVESDAGQALLEDVHQRVAGLDIPGQFRFRLRWSRFMMPVCMGALAFAALLFSPQLRLAWIGRAGAQEKTTAAVKEAQKQLDDLKKIHLQKNSEKPLSKEAKEIEKEFDKLLEKDPDLKTEAKVRETIEAMRNLEEKMKERIKELKELGQKSKELKKAMEQLDKLNKKLNSEGPGKEFQDALAKGNLKKAADELDKLRKKLENNQLSQAERDRLTDQLKQLKDNLDRLHDQKDEKDKLEKEYQEGKISKEELQRELDKLKQDMQDLQDLEDLADMIEDCRNCIGNGDLKELQGKLQRLKGKLEALDLDEAELQRLLDEERELFEARQAILGQCEGDVPGNGLGKGKHPGGKSPMGEEPKDSKTSDQRQQGEVDLRGKMRIAGFGKGGTFNKIPAKDVAGSLQQVDQQTSEVIDRQRIPADAADVAKDYFKKLGGQK